MQSLELSLGPEIQEDSTPIIWKCLREFVVRRHTSPIAVCSSTSENFLTGKQPTSNS
jgi:hypothetical protein